VPDALDDVEPLWLRRGVEQLLGVHERHDLVAITVDDEQRRAQVGHPAQAGVGVRDHRLRNERVMAARHIADAGEGRHQHQASRRALERKRKRHGAPDRLPEVDDTIRIHPRARDQR
jgi:hypothetical protein